MKNVKISRKIPMLVTISTIVCCAVIQIMAINISKNAFTESLENKLSSLLSSRKVTMDEYLQSIRDDLSFVATNFETIQSVKDFKYGWDSLEGNKMETLHKLYIEDNPHPLGEKENLDYAGDYSIYSEMHKEHHPWFRQFLRARGYYDIFIFDLNGNLLYTVFKELDYATNLITGKYKDTDLGNAYRAAAASTKQGEQFFFDFKPYAPSHGAPASFISTAVYNKNNEKIGVLVYQMPIDAINEQMAVYEGMGETGETFLVGQDYLMRSDARGAEESTILKTEIRDESTERALNGESGVTQTVGYKGHEVFAAFAPIDFMGTRWAIVAKQDEEEVMAPVDALERDIMIAAIAINVLLAIIGILASRTISKPLVRINEVLSDLAKGDQNVEIYGTDRSDEIGDLAKSAEVFKKNSEEKAELEKKQAATKVKAEAEKKAAMAQLADKFNEKVQGIIQAVSSAATQMSATAEQMASIITNTAEKSASATGASSQAADNVNAVAAASEELTASIQEVSEQVHNSNAAVMSTIEKTKSADASANALKGTTDNIGEVISLIDEIAEQINLLALNATIEAARAGEAGKGFAVVANEVKNLASQTVQATEDITKKIEEMKGASGDVTGALEEINSSIQSVSEYAGVIASAVEEQNSTTAEIAQSMQVAATGTQTINGNLQEISKTSNEASEAAQQVLQAAKELSVQSESLNSEVNAFITEIRNS